MLGVPSRSRLGELEALKAAADAFRFSRAHRLGPARYRSARTAMLHLLPTRVRLRGGLFVDVGANAGDWTAAVLEAVPGATCVCAEPGAEPLAQLRERFGDVDRVHIDPRAVSERSGSATLHRTRASVFASLLAPLEDLHVRYDLFGDPTEVLEQVPVQTVTLDELVGPRPVNVLKLDVQGGELQVLDGGAATLARTQAVLAEALFVPHYDGDATFGPLSEALRDHGFELHDITRPFRIDGGPALWADTSWVRSA